MNWQSVRIVTAILLTSLLAACGDLGDAQAYLDAGSDLQEQGKLDESLLHYDKAIGLDAELTLAYFKRGALYETRREFEKALEDYNETIRLDPQLAEAYFYRARTKTLQGQDIEAKQDVDRAVELGLDRAALEADIERIKFRR